MFDWPNCRSASYGVRDLVEALVQYISGKNSAIPTYPLINSTRFQFPMPTMSVTRWLHGDNLPPEIVPEEHVTDGYRVRTRR
jgi:hypothetical protein